MTTKTIIGEVEATEERNCGGCGWRVQRCIGEGAPLDLFDPILQIEHLSSTVGSTCSELPWMPYVGMVRCLYLIEGELDWVARHPTKGDKAGKVRQGDCFILHSHQGALIQIAPADTPMPRLQLLEVWIRDSVQNGHKDPLVDTYRSDELPRESGNGWEATVLLGKYSVVDPECGSLVACSTPSTVVDFTLHAGKSVEYEVPDTWQAVLYVYEGEVELQSNMQLVGEGRMTAFEAGGSLIEVWAKGRESRFVIVAGLAVGGRVERDGTLVAASKQELRSTMYRDAFDAAMRATHDVRAAHKQARIKRTDPSSPRSTASSGPGSPRFDAPGMEPTSPGSTSPSEFARNMLKLKEEMEDYEKGFKAYSVKWTAYLQKLQQRIKDNPANAELREEYKVRHRQYTAYIAQFNDKVKHYNEKKAVAAKCIADDKRQLQDHH